jgi:hypothetical protein
MLGPDHSNHVLDTIPLFFLVNIFDAKVWYFGTFCWIFVAETNKHQQYVKEDTFFKEDVLKIKYLFGLAITSNIYVNQKQELYRNTSLHRDETIWESNQKVVFDSSPPLGFGKRE